MFLLKKILLYYNIIEMAIFNIQLSETNFWYRKWILKVENFKLLIALPRVCVACRKKSILSVIFLQLGLLISPIGNLKYFTRAPPTVYSPVWMKFSRMFPSIYQELLKISKLAIYHWKALQNCYQNQKKIWSFQLLLPF